MLRSLRVRQGRGGALLATLVMLGSCAPSGSTSLAPEEKFTKWTRYEGEPGATHFSALDQIDRSNVHQLQVAWTYTKGSTGINPIVVDTMMFVIGAQNSLVALNAATGRELWSYSPATPGGVGRRGVMYWESQDRSDRRVYITRNNLVVAINAMTGQPVTSFGTNGEADLRQGITVRDTAGISVNPPSPGVVFQDILIFGSGPGEAYGSGPGDIRAFDARSGKLLWIFHTIPHPGEFGYDSWSDPEAYRKIGAANAWGGMSVDDKRGIVYIPLGSAAYDFYGADRIGNNLFANSLVALDARTGKRIWHYQTVHHDLWDYDLTATPTLLTVRHNGKMVDAVAQAAKTGFLFVFDRVTGEPLWPIEERAVPKSDMPGEVTSPTQPFPTWPRPFAVQKFTAEDINPYIVDPAERDSLVKIVRESNNLGLYTPPSTRPTMQMPGNSGGANWGSTGADPRNGSFYVVTKNLPTVLKLERILPGVFGTGTTQADRGLFTYQQNCQACHQATRAGQPPLIPSLVGVTDRLTPAQILAIVHEGKGNMPAFRDLSNQDVGAIVTYLGNPAAAQPLAAAGAGAPGSGGRVEDGGPLRFQTGYGYFSASGGMWGIKPPYMTMTKYDLNTGDIRWQVPIGEIPSLSARGITGTGAAQLAGGPAVTAGGLVFMTTGNALGAYDQETGKLLWSGQLPATTNGIPTVYQVGGRQYVTIGSAGGGGFGGGQGGNAPPPTQVFITFALPEGVVGRRSSR
jgi:quinoprotein glucose dehydrogenase